MYKVFYNDRIVFFISGKHEIENKPENQIHYFKTKELLKREIQNFKLNQQIQHLYIIYDDVEFAFQKFVKLYQLIEAAGGIVKNSIGHILVIHRRGKWDLPKGKMEKKETPRATAVREVEEECGITSLSVTRLINITYHTYSLGKKDILKKTYWYEMNYDGTKVPVPQTEEEITEVKWFDKNNLKEVIQNTFPSVIDVLKKCRCLT